jgi:hypothetical protein
MMISTRRCAVRAVDWDEEITMRKNVLPGAALVIGFACASAQKSQAPQSLASKTPDYKANAGTAVASNDPAKSKRKVICTYEAIVGSHIPEQTCRYEDEVNAQRGETQDTIRNYRNPNLHTGQ